MRSIAKIFLLAFLILAGCEEKNNSTFQASAIIEGTAIKVAAQTGGYLLHVNVEEGEQVEAGDTLAVIDAEKLGYQLAQIQASLDELNVQHRLAMTNLRRAQEDYDYAKIKYERYRDLFEKNAASQQTLDDLKIVYDRATTALESAKQSLQALASKEKGLAAQAKLLQRQINDAMVRAPISGTITTRFFDAGETIPPNAPIAEIIDLAKMWTKVYVSETYLPRIKIGQTAQVKIDGTNQTLAGTVTWISSKAEFTPKNILTPESRTALVYAVKISIENPDRILKHGMPVTIALHSTTTSN
ncbi:MAG: efflux RND transporter periplasmic adaptor subunit [candidate division KSB1 bacterium]|nr:efflux RND transporter periplasmic adaptor subunit [candidate division KSB1 bacterium]MDZ7365610.1 efflux RND transporter periplasmic adaptor subunit [candidate division KSB1 bacterium]MDZ7403314.1 efflux RND transporter periplasmic adaptor subunit [candidate division KSB1 bacterium]